MAKRLARKGAGKAKRKPVGKKKAPARKKRARR
jgi:hypothetical protein